MINDEIRADFYSAGQNDDYAFDSIIDSFDYMCSNYEGDDDFTEEEIDELKDLYVNGFFGAKRYDPDNTEEDKMTYKLHDMISSIKMNEHIYNKIKSVLDEIKIIEDI